MLRFLTSSVESSEASPSASTPLPPQQSSSWLLPRNRSQSTPSSTSSQLPNSQSAAAKFSLLPTLEDTNVNENTVAKVGEALRMRAATVSELDRDGDEVERMLKRNYSAMKSVIEDIKKLRMEVRNEADPSQAAREILRKQIESSSVKVLNLKDKLRKAKEIFTQVECELDEAERERSELCSQLAWVLQQGVGFAPSRSTGIGGESVNRRNSCGNEKLTELRARMNTIKSSVDSSEAAVREAALAADMSGRTGLVDSVVTSQGSAISDLTVMNSSIRKLSGRQSFDVPKRSSFMHVVANAPSTELEVPAPLLQYHTGDMKTSMTGSTIDIIGRQSSTEFEVPAPSSPMHQHKKIVGNVEADLKRSVREPSVTLSSP